LVKIWRERLFTSKELDKETGLYYYGARYLDPKTSRWLSSDPMMEKYLPVYGSRNNLPGEGGIFNTVNLCVYNYGGNNPVKYVDPNGNDIYDVNIFKDSQAQTSSNEFLPGVSSYDTSDTSMPNTIYWYGCLYTSTINVANYFKNTTSLQHLRKGESPNSYKHTSINDKNLPGYFHIKQKEGGGEDVNMSAAKIKALVEDVSGVKVNVTQYGGAEARKMIENYANSKENVAIIANVGGHPNIDQHWVNLLGVNEVSPLMDILGAGGDERYLDYIETYPIFADEKHNYQYQLKHVDTIYVVEPIE